MLVCLIRSVFLYMTLVIAIRLMGKRQLGEMEPSEFVVAMLIADLASVPMQDLGIPLLSGFIPILTVLCLEIILSVLSFHSITIRKLFCGKPVILMENGQIIYEKLQKNRLTPDELTEHLREKGIVDLRTVKYAILETNGQISALVDPAYQPPSAQDQGISVNNLELPVTLISCGKKLKHNLEIAGRSEKWLNNVLKQHHCSYSDILLMTVEPNGKIYLSKMKKSS